MAEQLQFERRGERRWFADLDGGAFYRIEEFPGGTRSDFDLQFIERVADRWSNKGWSLRYEKVSTHRSLERAIERANRHYHDRATLAEA